MWSELFDTIAIAVRTKGFDFDLLAAWMFIKRATYHLSTRKCTDLIQDVDTEGLDLDDLRDGVEKRRFLTLYENDHRIAFLRQHENEPMLEIFGEVKLLKKERCLAINLVGDKEEVGMLLEGITAYSKTGTFKIGEE